MRPEGALLSLWSPPPSRCRPDGGGGGGTSLTRRGERDRVRGRRRDLERDLLRRRWRDRLRGRPNRGQARPVPDSVARLGLYRYHTGPWCASHLCSYRKFLWDEIRDEDLRDDDGEYFCSAADVATMLPLMEMAGPEHARYLPDILYVYNNDHASSDNQEPVAAYERQQFICALKIRAKPRYQRLLR